jgi:hypothetical protein
MRTPGTRTCDKTASTSNARRKNLVGLQQLGNPLVQSNLAAGTHLQLYVKSLELSLKPRHGFANVGGGVRAIVSTELVRRGDRDLDALARQQPT